MVLKNGLYGAGQQSLKYKLWEFFLLLLIFYKIFDKNKYEVKLLTIMSFIMYRVAGNFKTLWFYQV